MDLVLNNLERLICHKNPTNQQKSKNKFCLIKYAVKNRINYKPTFKLM